MKNFIALFLSLTVILLVSCSKEPLLRPENSSVPVVELEKANHQSLRTIDDYSIQASNAASNMHASTTISFQVVKMTASEVAGEFLVDFAASYDFSEVVLAENQNLDFVDTNNQESTLSFTVNSSEGGNGTLQVTFAVGGNDLTGLSLDMAQEIIIEDLTVN